MILCIVLTCCERFTVFVPVFWGQEREIVCGSSLSCNSFQTFVIIFFRSVPEKPAPLLIRYGVL